MKARVKYSIIIIFLALAATAGVIYRTGGFERFLNTSTVSPTPISDKYLSFIMEVHDKVIQNFWDKLSEEKLGNLYKLASEKATSRPALLEPKTRQEIIDLAKKTMAGYSEDQKKDYAAKLSDIVLYNLEPAGRSRLYTEKDEEVLQNRVQNAIPTVDPSGMPSLKIEPTVTYRLLTPDIFYIKLSRFSPQSLDEFKKAADSISPKEKTGPTALVFDLRGNIGGAIDILQYFLGPFIGIDNYAYDFYHQGEKIPYKTKLGWFESLVRYKKVVTLIDGTSQSSAEVMAAVLKKYNVGVVVGAPTRGWGTVEQVISLDNQISSDEKYSVFLVNSVTLRDDGQPIEGRGVDPTINITDKDWYEKLMAYYNYRPLADAVKKLVE